MNQSTVLASELPQPRPIRIAVSPVKEAERARRKMATKMVYATEPPEAGRSEVP